MINSVVLPPSQNQVDPQIRREFNLTESRLDERRYGLICEYGLANYTGTELAVVHANGKVDFIPSLVATSTNGFAQIDFISNHIDQTDLESKSLVIPKEIGFRRKFYGKTSINIPVEKLMRGPQFVPECGFVLAIGEHINRAQSCQVNGEDFNNQALDLAAQKYFSKFSTPMLILANQHEKVYDKLYIAQGSIVTSVPVVSMPRLPEGVIVVFNDNKRTKIRLGFSWDKPDAYKESKYDQVWIVGTSYSSVLQLSTKHIETMRELVSPEVIEERVDLEVKKHVKKSTKKIKKQAEEIDSLKDTIKLLKQDKANLALELERSESKMSYSSKERAILHDDYLQQQKVYLAASEARYKEKEMQWKTITSVVASGAAILGAVVTIAKLLK